MLVAITGANGFIGGHLVRGFELSGAAVRPIVRRDYETDALDERFADVDIVIHAAGATRAPSRARLRRSNFDLTARTLDAATRAGVRRFVFISSQAAAGPATALDAPLTELDSPHPIDAYGKSKLEAELSVRESALPWVIVRPAAVYGRATATFGRSFDWPLAASRFIPAIGGSGSRSSMSTTSCAA
jgi:nucleoside-diphosphate-sugar epimerase